MGCNLPASAWEQPLTLWALNCSQGTSVGVGFAIPASMLSPPRGVWGRERVGVLAQSGRKSGAGVGTPGRACRGLGGGGMPLHSLMPCEEVALPASRLPF